MLRWSCISSPQTLDTGACCASAKLLKTIRLLRSLHVGQGFDIIWEEVKIKGQNCEMDVPMFAEWFLSSFKWEFIEVEDSDEDDGLPVKQLICAGVNYRSVALFLLHTI